LFKFLSIYYYIIIIRIFQCPTDISIAKKPLDNKKMPAQAGNIYGKEGVKS